LAALLGLKRFESMIDFGISDADGSANPDPGNKRRTSFQGPVLVLLYAIILLLAMGGWLWFLGWLSWHVVVWAMGD
jgi:hypothetical protein